MHAPTANNRAVSGERIRGGFVRGVSVLPFECAEQGVFVSLHGVHGRAHVYAFRKLYAVALKLHAVVSAATINRILQYYS